MELLHRGAAPKGNLRLYCVFLAATGFVLDRAVFLVYVGRHGLDVQQVALCEAMFQLAIVMFEIPTGWVSDRFGRKTSLMVGTSLLAAYNMGMLLVQGFAGYMGMMALCAFAYTFLSGSDNSLLYELVEAVRADAGGGTERNYLSYSSRAMAGQQIMLGVSALFGALLASYSWTMLYLLMVGVYAAEFAMLVVVKEPQAGRGAGGDPSRNRPGRVRPRTFATHWTTYAPAWVFAVFLAATAALDMTAMGYANSTQIIFAASGIALPMIGLFSGSSRLANAGAYLLAGWLTKRFGRKAVLVGTLAAQSAAFVLLPLAAGSPMTLLSVSVMALFLAEMLFIVVESVTQDYLVNATRARILSVISMVRSLMGVALYAVIGTTLKLWGVGVTLGVLAVMMLALTVAALAVAAQMRRMHE